ncbi:MAG: ABC transporter ATP-binding protein [Bdellovibrionales bacterium]
MSKSSWKKLLLELKDYKKDIFWVFILGLFTSGLKGLIPEMVNRLFSSWQTGDQHLAWIIPPALALVWVLSSVTRFYHLYFMKYAADKISVAQRRSLMDKYLSLNLSFFQEFEYGSGGLISRMVNDIGIIQTGFQKIADAVREPFMLIGMFGYLLYLDWKLTVFILLVLPIVTAVLRQLARSLRKYSNENQEIMENLTRTLKESLDGTRVVQSFCLEDEMRRKFNEQAQDFLRNRKKIIGREEAAGPISESLTAIFICTLLVYIGYQVFHQNFTLANFMSFMFAMGLLQDSIRRMQDSYIKIQQATVGLDRLYDILDAAPTVQSPEVTVPFPANWQTIEFKNVSFAFKDDLVLKNVNLLVKKSETIALVGSSGSGKSTLVNLLQRFFDPTKGEILVDNISIKKFDLKDLRKNIALVTQDVFLFNDSIEKNILMGDLAETKEHVISSAKMANAHDFIMQTPKGYETKVGDFGNRMSGGEKQRISIARAMLKNSSILVLDEATSALDSESEQEVQKGINHLLQGRTAFIIAHRLSTISKANRIIVMKKGSIIEEGTHSKLLEQHGEYYKFHQMQFLSAT